MSENYKVTVQWHKGVQAHADLRIGSSETGNVGFEGDEGWGLAVASCLGVEGLWGSMV